MTKHLFFLAAAALGFGSMTCSGGDYCRDNCEYVARCSESGAPMDQGACVDACEKQLESVPEDCRDALDNLGSCASDLSCEEVQWATDCVDESLDVLQECGEFFGIDDDESCEGPAYPCESIYDDQSACEVQGCTYAVTCGGYADPCAAISSQTECEQQSGCSYGGTSCTGTAAECSTLGESQCATQTGCDSDSTCTGTPYDCSTFPNETTCETVDGCHWY